MSDLEIYTPSNAKPLSESQSGQQIRLGIQGEPKTGKTWAALTFPNPIVANCDRGLSYFSNRSDIIEVPFWDPVVCDKIKPRDGTACPPNRKDAILKWLYTDGVKLTKNQTFILDSISQLETYFGIQYNLNPRITKQGKIDEFGYYDQFKDYMNEIFELLKTFKCNVIILCHESPDRGDTGQLNGKARPLVSGQFRDKIASHCTDWFRTKVINKPTEESKQRVAVSYKVSVQDVDQWILSSDKECNNTFLWQTQPDDSCQCGTATLKNPPKFIPAGYKYFSKYMQ